MCICWICIFFWIILCRLVEYACTSLSLLAGRCVCVRVSVWVCVHIHVCMFWAPGLFSAWAGPGATKPSLIWPISKAPHTHSHTYVHMISTSRLSCLSETIRHAHTNVHTHLQCYIADQNTCVCLAGVFSLYVLMYLLMCIQVLVRGVERALVSLCLICLPVKVHTELCFHPVHLHSNTAEWWKSFKSL